MLSQTLSELRLSSSGERAPRSSLCDAELLAGDEDPIISISQNMHRSPGTVHCIPYQAFTKGRGASPDQQVPNANPKLPHQ